LGIPAIPLLPRPAERPRWRTRIENTVDRHSVRVGAWLLRRTRGRIVRLWRRRALVLTTTGRRSGLPRTVIVQYFPAGRDMVVVAANSGMPTHPAWYVNLTERPEARVEVDGRTMAVRAEELSADEAAAWWPRVLTTAPDYERFRTRTGRRLPLLRLVPQEQGEGSSSPPGVAVPADPQAVVTSRRRKATSPPATRAPASSSSASSGAADHGSAGSVGV
jgi:deazaflavin-dependent oxidoreductase (nitroreductase family)